MQEPKDPTYSIRTRTLPSSSDPAFRPCTRSQLNPSKCSQQIYINGSLIPPNLLESIQACSATEAQAANALNVFQTYRRAKRKNTSSEANVEHQPGNDQYLSFLRHYLNFFTSSRFRSLNLSGWPITPEKFILWASHHPFRTWKLLRAHFRVIDLARCLTHQLFKDLFPQLHDLPLLSHPPVSRFMCNFRELKKPKSTNQAKKRPKNKSKAAESSSKPNENPSSKDHFQLPKMNGAGSSSSKPNENLSSIDIQLPQTNTAESSLAFKPNEKPASEELPKTNDAQSSSSSKPNEKSISKDHQLPQNDLLLSPSSTGNSLESLSAICSQRPSKRKRSKQITITVSSSEDELPLSVAEHPQFAQPLAHAPPVDQKLFEQVQSFPNIRLREVQEQFFTSFRNHHPSKSSTEEIIEKLRKPIDELTRLKTGQLALTVSPEDFMTCVMTYLKFWESQGISGLPIEGLKICFWLDCFEPPVTEKEALDLSIGFDSLAQRIASSRRGRKKKPPETLFETSPSFIGSALWISFLDYFGWTTSPKNPSTCSSPPALNNSFHLDAHDHLLSRPPSVSTIGSSLSSLTRSNSPLLDRFPNSIESECLPSPHADDDPCALDSRACSPAFVGAHRELHGQPDHIHSDQPRFKRPRVSSADHQAFLTHLAQLSKLWRP